MVRGYWNLETGDLNSGFKDFNLKIEKGPGILSKKVYSFIRFVPIQGYRFTANKLSDLGFV
jgi:hypothetical protein